MSDRAIEPLPVTLNAALRERLGRDTVEKGLSLNDLVVGILAAAFKIPFEPVGGHPGQQTGSTSMNLRLPPAIYQAIEDARPRQPRGSRSKRAVVERVLCKHYDLPYVVPTRTRRRRPRADAVAS